MKEEGQIRVCTPYSILKLKNLFCGTLRSLREPKIILPQTSQFFAEKFAEVVYRQSRSEHRDESSS